jgi:citrate lyase beta subunit
MSMTNDALALGATLYLPATRSYLHAALFEGRIPGLRSAVVCLEDAVADADVPHALDRLAALLRTVPADAGPALFVRPRAPAMLERIVRLPGAERLAGFVLPKMTADTLPDWLAADLAPAHRLMPTLETREAFDGIEMRRLRDQLLTLGDRVLALRIGGNDLLHAIGARRSRVRTVYDGPLGPAIARLVGVFAPFGFALTGPVMERYDDPQLLREEVARDLEHGLLGKTAIHPAQVPVIHAALAVASDELAEAQAILAADAPAVFALGGGMAEPATHRRWAALTVRRAGLYGVADPLPLVRRG